MTDDAEVVSDVCAATHMDVVRLVDMGRRFHAQSRLPVPFDVAATERFLDGMIENPSACVMMHDHGAIGGMLLPAYCGPSWMMAVELFWWAERDGMRLLRAFETWAHDNAANEVRMTTLAALPRADTLLRRVGYAPCEISYQKVI